MASPEDLIREAREKLISGKVTYTEYLALREKAVDDIDDDD